MPTDVLYVRPSLQRTGIEPSTDQVLWPIIRNRARAISFVEYKKFIDAVMCSGGTAPDGTLMSVDRKLPFPFYGPVRISPENAATLYALVKKFGLKNTEVVLTGVTPGGEYKVARAPAPRYADEDEFNSYYAQPQWGGGFFGRSFSGPYYNGSQRYYRPAPPRGY